MLYLIDGYNLLFALGVLLPKRTGPQVLEKARLYLFTLLHETLGDQAGVVTVVFDAKHPPPHAPSEYVHEGLHIAFAREDGEADELIERRIREAATPRALTVVSDDHRIQQAGRRRQCVVQGCGAFLDWLEQQRRPKEPKPPEEHAKPERLSREEMQRWLREFGDIENDPGWKELFDEPWSDGDTEPGGH